MQQVHICILHMFAWGADTTTLPSEMRGGVSAKDAKCGSRPNVSVGGKRCKGSVLVPRAPGTSGWRAPITRAKSNIHRDWPITPEFAQVLAKSGTTWSNSIKLGPYTGRNRTNITETLVDIALIQHMPEICFFPGNGKAEILSATRQPQRQGGAKATARLYRPREGFSPAGPAN